VGDENFFLFGLTAEQVAERLAVGYRPVTEVEANPELHRVLGCIVDGTFSRGNPGLFRPLVENLLNQDPFLVLADYAAYVGCQERVSAEYATPEEWTRKSILNVARMGWFSSDRSIREYCESIWKIKPVEVKA
jgi:starch phosphorylase